MLMMRVVAADELWARQFAAAVEAAGALEEVSPGGGGRGCGRCVGCWLHEKRVVKSLQGTVEGSGLQKLPVDTGLEQGLGPIGYFHEHRESMIINLRTPTLYRSHGRPRGSGGKSW